MERPRTGVSILVVREGRVLLVLRGREPYALHWSLPGGSQEPGETLEQAARRELAEETGLIAGELAFAEIFEPMLRDDAGRVVRHFVLGIFVCRSHTGKAIAGDDAAAAAWHGIDALDTLAMTPGTAEIIRRLSRHV